MLRFARLASQPLRRFSAAAKPPAGGAMPSYEATMLPADYAAYKHAIGTVNWWGYFNVIVVIPALAGTGYFVWNREREHKAHFHKPEFTPWPHLHKRRSIYPWGDGTKTLFHNDDVNPLPAEE